MANDIAERLIKMASVQPNHVAAPVQLASTVDDLEGKLQPGDIVLTKANDAQTETFGLGKDLWSSISKLFNKGNEWGHAGLYMGNGKVIHMYDKLYQNRFGQEKSVRIHQLRALANKQRDMLVLRPDVTEKQKQRALQRARMLIGAEYGNWSLLRTGLFPGKSDINQVPEKVICSAVPAYAYPNINFREGAGYEYVRPADFFDNPRLSQVLAYSSEQSGGLVEPEAKAASVTKLAQICRASYKKSASGRLGQLVNLVHAPDDSGNAPDQRILGTARSIDSALGQLPVGTEHRITDMGNHYTAELLERLRLFFRKARV